MRRMRRKRRRKTTWRGANHRQATCAPRVRMHSECRVRRRECDDDAWKKRTQRTRKRTQKRREGHARRGHEPTERSGARTTQHRPNSELGDATTRTQKVNGGNIMQKESYLTRQRERERERERDRAPLTSASVSRGRCARSSHARRSERNEQAAVGEEKEESAWKHGLRWGAAKQHHNTITT